MGGGGAASGNITCMTMLCSHPHFIPEWMPSSLSVPIATRFGRALTFFIALIYIFVGLSFISDIFYTSLEVMVSKKRKVKVISRVTGTEQTVSIPVWNEAVAHFCVFVLGNSAPEIMLSIIETVMMKFQIGEVGPMVILGGQFNLFLTAGICILSAKGAKKQHELAAFFVQVVWGGFAYGWLYTILQFSSAGVVEVWEAVMTVMFFPIMVVSAYLVDRKFFGVFHRLVKRIKLKNKAHHSSKKKQPTSNSSAGTLASTVSSKSSANNASSEKVAHESGGESDEEHEHGEHGEHGVMDEVEHARMQLERRQARFLNLAKTLRIKHRHLNSSKIYDLAEAEVIKEMPKSMSYYRMLASKGLDLLNKNKLRSKNDHNKVKRFEQPNEQLISFDPVEYRVMENVGSFDVNVIREGERLNNCIAVSYSTEDGTGVAGSDYFSAKGRIIFKPGEKVKHIPIKVIDEEVFTLDTQFYVNLFDPEVIDRRNDPRGLKPDLKLDPDLRRAGITKMSDDHGGIFQFEREALSFEEDIGEARIKIVRSGVKKNVMVQYRVIPDTAIPGVHFTEHDDMDGLILFKDCQTEGFIVLNIVNEEKLEKNVSFRIELDEPFWEEEKDAGDDSSSRRSANSSRSKKSGLAKFDISQLAAPRLGEITNAIVTITENVRLRKAVENISNIDLTDLVSSGSWASQFVEAVTVTPSLNVDDDDGKEETVLSISTKPGCKDYLSHYITLFWKLMFAFIPPTSYMRGTASFMIAFVFIGGLMALAGDCAIQLGCAMGLKIEMTAITFVAMGVSLPDIFASRLAATKEAHADAAIGHMVGRIPVSIFVGFGLTWSLASIKNAIDGKTLVVNVKALPFNVLMFVCYAGIAIVTLLLRRLPPVRGELGGPRGPATVSALLFISLWLSYIILFALVSYCVMPSF